MQISSLLAPLLTTPKRFKIIIGGRGSGKSQGVADIMLVLCAQGEKIGCFREFQNSMQDSVYSLLAGEIRRLDLPGFDIQAKQILHSSGGMIVFKGLSRNPDAVKSMHGFKKFWIEEAQALSDESLRVLTPTLREGGSELWFTANPMSAKDPFSQRFIKPFEIKMAKDQAFADELHMIIKCNYTDNPWFPDVLEQDRLFDYTNLPRALYDHIWLGAYNDSVESAIISAEWFDACVDAHLKLGFKSRGQTVAAHDPSESGDARGYACRYGSILTDCQMNSVLDVNDACDWALGLTINARADVFAWDADGLGISLKRQINEALEAKRIEIYAFRGGAEVEDAKSSYDNQLNNHRDLNNEDAFKNLRAQMYCRLRDRMQATYNAIEKKEYTDPDKMFSIDSSINCLSQLKSELCRIPTYPNPNGMIQIMRKDQMKKMKIASPNLADSVMMTMVGQSFKRKQKQYIPPSCIA